MRIEVGEGCACDHDHEQTERIQNSNLVKQHSNLFGRNTSEQQLAFIAGTTEQPEILRAPSSGVHAGARSSETHHLLVLLLSTMHFLPQTHFSFSRADETEKSLHRVITLSVLDDSSS